MSQFARAAGLLAALCCSAAWSVEIEQVVVRKMGKIFSTEAIFLVEAPREAVVGAVTNFDRLSELNTAVVSSIAEVLESGETRVTTRLRDCVSLFCRSVDLVEDVRLDQAGNLQSRIVPELSDFVSGNASWQFDTVGNQTRVHYQSRMQPKFWLPPLLGSAAFRHALGRQIKSAAHLIETLATPDRLSDLRRPAMTGLNPFPSMNSDQSARRDFYCNKPYFEPARPRVEAARHQGPESHEIRNWSSFNV